MIKALSLCVLLFSTATIEAGYIYEGNQGLFDLTTHTNTTNMAASDDGVSSAFNLDFTFTFYGEDFTSARMATNGCLHFGSSGGYCNDYTPDPLPEITYTLYPFWTDLIRDNGSSVLAKNFTDKTVFGWYDLREYNRSGSDNSFEVILWKSNDTFEFRYGALDIIQHDVLIGEQGKSDELYTYLFHDECSTGTTNVAGTCVNTNWNNTSFNTSLESGGSLYGLGSGNSLDCSNPLNDSACPGYAAAYLNQQCNIDSLYDSACPLYWEAYDDLQCSLDSQYAPFCPGYTQEQSVAYYTEEEFDYGYEEETDYGYTEENMYGYEVYDEEEYLVETYEFIEEETYEYTEEVLLFEEEYIFAEEIYLEEEYLEIDYTEEEIFIEEMEYAPETLDQIEEILPLPIEEYYDPSYQIEYISDYTVAGTQQLTEIYEFETIISESFDYEEEDNYLDLETQEELEEWFEREMDETEPSEVAEETEEVSTEEAEESTEEIAQERYAENEEESSEEKVNEKEEINEEEIDLAEEKESNSIESALSIVSQTIVAAANSVSGTQSGNSIHATGNTVASGGISSTASTQASAVSSSTSSGGISTSSSPSSSDQFMSAAAQNQSVLKLSPVETTATVETVQVESESVSTETSVATVATNESSQDSQSEKSSQSSATVSDVSGLSESTTTVVAEVQVQDMKGEIENATSNVMTASEADQIADKIIAQNLKAQQEELQQIQQQTGEYGDQTSLVAYLGYVPGFDDYRQARIPEKQDWYQSRTIYANAKINDNTQAFYNLAGTSLNKLSEMVALEPTL